MRFLDPPEEEARHRELIANLGLYDADWAVAKMMEQSDVAPGQNRLLLTSLAVRGGPIPKLFPELEELREDGKNAQNTVSVTMLNAEPQVEKETGLVFLNSNSAYRIKGPGWRQFVVESGVARGDRLDLYTCRRRYDGRRCLFVFRSNGDGGGGLRGNARSSRDYNAKRDYIVKKEDGVHACTGGDYSAAARSSDPSCCKGRDETTREKEMKAPRNLLWDAASKLEKQAAIGLLKLAWDCY